MAQKSIKLIGSKGITLIEILVVMVIMGILGSALLSMQFFLSQNQVAVFRNYLSVDDTNRIVTEFTRELRAAQVSESGSYPLTTALDQDITFYSDYDFDGTVERVRYYLSGSQLIKEVIEPSGQPPTYPDSSKKVKVLSDIIRNATNPVFFYYNSDWPTDAINNPLGPGSRISHTRLVRMNLSANPALNDPIKDFDLESYAKLRYIRNNTTCYFDNPQPPGSTSALCAPPSDGSPSSSCGSFGNGICCRYECSGGFTHWCERTSGPPGSCSGYMDCGPECNI